MSNTHNILIISDLHLGEDLNPSAGETCRRDLALAERKLIEFLRYYTRRRAGGRPWRLVINGDMIDFLAIPLDPRKVPGLDLDALSPGEHTFGAARREAVARAQLAAVMQRHAEVMRVLGRFLAVGNRVDIVCGNHDTEFHWESVQELFRDGLVRALTAGFPDGADRADAETTTAARIRDGLGFHSWFVYEPGVAWIEHGHQYDECCSHEHGLEPVGPDGVILSNVDTAAMRNITNQLSEADPHGADDWSFGGYVQFAAGLGARGALRLARGYYGFAADLLRVWRQVRAPRMRRARSRVHDERLEALARQRAVPARALRNIDRLRRLPVAASLRRLAHVLMLDRLVVYGAGALAALAALVALPLLPALLITLLALAGAIAASRVLARARNIDPALPMQLTPGRILEQVDADCVVFGHTHEPEAHALGGGKWYFNTGTWLPTGKPGILRAFTHVVIRHGARGAVASLCQWRDGKSRAFTPTGAPVPAAEPVALPAMPGEAPVPAPIPLAAMPVAVSPPAGKRALAA